MAKILALDTSSEACSVALWVDGDVHEDFQLVPRQHTHKILPMVEQILARAGLTLRELDALAFGRGPGSFTGLRITTGVVQGLAFGAELPVIPVSTLAALAYEAYRESGLPHVLAMLDARMGEVYWGTYRCSEGRAERLGSEHVSRPEDVILPEDGETWCGIGPGWRYAEQLPETLRERVHPVAVEHFPRAGDLARLAVAELAAGHTVAPEQALPVYLRDNVAKKKGEK